MKNKISIIITSRNYGHFLEECIKSCQKQTIEPFEIIYSDDFSEDNSVEIAEKMGVKVIKQDRHLGVVKARNAGFEASTGDIITFMDGDDTLPEDFLEKQLEVFSDRTSFVYPAAQAFGLHDTFWKVSPWNDLFIWDRNFCNTVFMAWRDVFEEAGRWQETPENTMWDWSMALRMSRVKGRKPAMSSAFINYRQHNSSWSTKKEKMIDKKTGKDDENLHRIINSVRHDLLKMTIGLIYSGRIPFFLKPWMKNLVKDIKILKNKPQLIILNNSAEPIKDVLSKFEHYFSEIIVITGEPRIVGLSEIDRRNKVAELLSCQYNRILELSTGELIHLREDDITSKGDAFKRLYNFMTDGSKVPRAAGGAYQNRNPEWNKVVGGIFAPVIRETQDFDFISTVNNDPLEADFTGTGYLMFWKDRCPVFKPYCHGVPAHDWAWGHALKGMGEKLYILPDAKAKHHHDENDYVLPNIVYFKN